MIDLIKTFFGKRKAKSPMEEMRDKRKQLYEETRYLTVQIEQGMKIVPIGTSWLELCEGLKVMMVEHLKAEEYTLALVHARKDCIIAPHRHCNTETLWVISGTHIDSVSGETHLPGQMVEYAEKVLHGSYFPEETVLLIKWKPSLAERLVGVRKDFSGFSNS